MAILACAYPSVQHCRALESQYAKGRNMLQFPIYYSILLSKIKGTKELNFIPSLFVKFPHTIPCLLNFRPLTSEGNAACATLR